MPKIKIGGREFEITSEDLTKDIIEISDKVIIRTEEEDNAFQNNLKQTAKTAGLEIAIKDARTKLGLNFEGKTIDNLIDAVKQKAVADANIEPTEQLKAKEKDIETLKTTISTLTNEKESAFNQLKSFKNETIVNNSLLSVIPENVVLPKNDVLLILKNKFNFEADENGKILVKKDGEVIKNTTTLDPIPPKEIITKFFEENPTYLKGVEGGAGGSDSGSNGGKMTVDKYVEQAQKDGKNVNSEEFIKELETKIKDGVVA
jgi:hypothetical protein